MSGEAAFEPGSQEPVQIGQLAHLDFQRSGCMLDVRTGRQVAVDVRALPVSVVDDCVHRVLGFLSDRDVQDQRCAVETSLRLHVSARCLRQAVGTHGGRYGADGRAANRQRRGELNIGREIVGGSVDLAGCLQRAGKSRGELREVGKTEIEAETHVPCCGACGRATQSQRQRAAGQGQALYVQLLVVHRSREFQFGVCAAQETSPRGAASVDAAGGVRGQSRGGAIACDLSLDRGGSAYLLSGDRREGSDIREAQFELGALFSCGHGAPTQGEEAMRGRKLHGSGLRIQAHRAGDGERGVPQQRRLWPGEDEPFEG